MVTSTQYPKSRAAHGAIRTAFVVLIVLALAPLVRPRAAQGQCPEPGASRTPEFDFDVCEPVGVPFVDKVIIDKLLNGVCKLVDVGCSTTVS